MKYIVALFLIAFSTQLDAQVNASIQLKQLNAINKDQKQYCYSLEIVLAQEKKIFLASQNYRLYYNSSEIKYLPELSILKLSQENYDLRIVQDMSGINATGIGNLPFEDNLGFINASIVLMGPSTSGTSLKEPDVPLEIGQFCFESLKSDSKPQIVFARDKYTSTYGRAFSEISIFNMDHQITSLNIIRYGDIND